jgi:alkylhydroperoxidase/carboxymuconolactone decarboxylase family protein YurZ
VAETPEDFRAAGRRVAVQLFGEDGFGRLERGARDESIAPLLDQGLLAWSLYERPGLDVRTRLLVTLAVDAAGGWTNALKHHVHACLDNDITPAEINEVLVQIAPYTGMPAINQALAVAAECYRRHDG